MAINFFVSLFQNKYLLILSVSETSNQVCPFSELRPGSHLSWVALAILQENSSLGLYIDFILTHSWVNAKLINKILNNLKEHNTNHTSPYN